MVSSRKRLAGITLGALLLAPLSLRAQSFCEPVAVDALVNPTVLGTGSPGTVTTAAIQSALNTGGHILFNVGPGPSTITVTSTLTINKAVVLDGAGTVTLSGGGARRILQIAPQPSVPYAITLQNISFANASVPGGRGGAIFNESGGFWQRVSLKIVNASFNQNAAMSSGQDDGGGALYATGLDHVRIGNSTFTNNSGSNGGAVYSLGSQRLTIVDSVFNANHATGTGGNPGNGGNAGAVGVDGASRLVDICRTTFVDNTSNAYGAGFFSVMYPPDVDNPGPSRTRFEDVTFESNEVLSTDRFAAGAYVQDGPFAFERVSFLRNEANGYTGLFITGPLASGSIRNSTFVGNIARTGLGAAMSIGTSSPVSIVNTTIANNVATAAFAAGISVGAGNQLRLTNVILSNNTGGNAFVNWNIQNAASQDGGGNMQWPQFRPNGGAETRATPSTTFADPLLAASDAANGGFVRTIALTSGSPARDTGASTGEVPPTDARGMARVGPPDRGSYEFAPPSAMSIGDASVTEGSAGTVPAPFAVTLSPAAIQPITVQYATANNTATAGSDYVGIPLTTLTFSPGETSKTISVTVNGDILDEANETFFVNLSNASSGATITDNQGVGTITDDDTTTVSASDASIVEGMSGATTAWFAATLSTPSAQTVTVPYSTVDSSATAGTDYTAASGVLTFLTGETVQPVPVTVSGDVDVEVNETFFLNLGVPTNATVADGQGVGTILNDDPPGPSALADFLMLGQVHQTDVSAATATRWFKVRLAAGRSYAASAWAPGTDPTESTVTLDLAWFMDDGVTAATGTNAAATEPIPDVTGHDGTASSIIPTFTQCPVVASAGCTYRVRLQATGATSLFPVRLVVVETTLVSPYWSVVTAAGYDAAPQIRNNTGTTLSAVFTAYSSSGSLICSNAFTVPAQGMTTFAVSGAPPGCAITTGFGSAQIAHHGPPGSITANVTTFSSLSGLSFDAPFRLRNTWTSLKAN